MHSIIQKQLENLGISFMGVDLLASFIQIFVIVGICYLVFWSVRKIVMRKIISMVKKSTTKWDDKLINAGFFNRVLVLVPIVVIFYFVEEIFTDFPNVLPIIVNLLEVVMAILLVRVFMSLLDAALKILESKESFKDKPLKSYGQLTKILIYLISAITIFSLLTGETPMFFLTAMGTMSAIIILVFKDTILGFIGSIQLAANDMVRIGDWITMDKYGADGSVIDISLATVKVKNFDLTITTIPTYSLTSDSFKNWRGMKESSGRRIKRAINLKISSIKFCTPELLEKIKKIHLIAPYINQKNQEIEAYNASKEILQNDLPNARSLTNIGIFREYLKVYLENNVSINHNLTCMVRQLTLSNNGLPLEIYAFSKQKDWAKYESVIADIFDHVLAVVHYFELEVFQNPAGSDFSQKNPLK